MSTFAYGAMTKRRNQADPGKSTDEEPPGLKTYVDLLAALVPAEVLAAHAVIIAFTTSTEEGEGGEDVTTITDPGTLEWVFWALIGASAVLYVLGLTHRPRGYGWLRILIPPLAFVGWAMLQNPSVFDAVNPDLSEGTRLAIVVIGAILVGAVATALAAKADNSPATPD